MKRSRCSLRKNSAGIAVAAVGPRRARRVSALTANSTAGLDLKLFPSQKEVWEAETFMNDLGPRLTGSPAQAKYVDFLDANLRELGLQLSRLRYTIPRWEAHRWALEVEPAGASKKPVAVTSYYPYSGKTPAEGISGELVYGGAVAKANWSGIDAKGKIVMFDMAIPPIALSEWYKVWEVYDERGDHDFPSSEYRACFAVTLPPTLLKDALAAGASGVVIAWENISDGNARYQYAPFNRPYADMPALWVGKKTGAELRQMAGARATLTLDAEIIPNSPTDTLIATLPGVSADEIILVNTHTDGPNAFQENGGIGLLTCAKYFSRLPKASRNRTIVFVLSTGHFAEPYISSAQWLKDRPDLVEKAVASVSMEHLGVTEWVDDASLMHYRPTGKTEMNFAFCPSQLQASILSDALKGTAAGRIAVVEPGKHMMSMGAPVYHAGIPTISYISFTNYMQVIPPNGYIDKLDPRRMHGEIQAFAGAIQRLDKAKAEDLRANTPAKGAPPLELHP